MAIDKQQNWLHNCCAILTICEYVKCDKTRHYYYLIMWFYFNTSRCEYVKMWMWKCENCIMWNCIYYVKMWKWENVKM